MISADLGRNLEKLVANLVETGRYNSKSEVLREGVRLVQEREARLAALDAALSRSLADAKAGRTKPADEVFDRLEAKYRTAATGSRSTRRHFRQRIARGLPRPRRVSGALSARVALGRARRPSSRSRKLCDFLPRRSGGCRSASRAARRER